MKRYWEVDELIEHWTLLPDEIAFLGNKAGANCLGCAALLKFFQYETKFPAIPQDVPGMIVDYIAKQVDVPSAQYLDYDWNGRSIKRHRGEIRSFLGIRKASVKDAKQMVDWLINSVLASEVDLEHLKVVVEQQFLQLKIEPPTPGRIERLIKSALRTYETNFFEATFKKLSSDCCAQIDALLTTSDTGDEENQNGSEETTKTSLFNYLNSDPGRASLDSFLSEITKLQHIRQIGLPDDLFQQVSVKVLHTYKIRAATEPPRELRWHPEPIRYTLVAAFCWIRAQEVIDNLVDLLMQIVHGIGARAERRVDIQLMRDFKKVGGKHNLLYRIADASLEQPSGTVKEVIYPVVSEQTLKDLVKEFKANGTAYREKVHTVIRSSYSRHYRRIVPKLLAVLEFRSNNDVHRPVIQALELLKKYADSKQRYYSPEDEVPIEGVLKSGWREILLEKNTEGNERINRINYEISVLQALRDRLRCKEIWVMGANRYRNPDEDLPSDFEQQREIYYQALKQPLSVEEFIIPLKQGMMESLATLNDGLPKNPAKVVNAIFATRLPEIWGEGTTACASDSKKFGAWDQNLMTEWHIRYGGRGVMIYWHVEKKSTCIYSQLKTCSSSEVAAMIEGVLRHDTEMTVKKNFVDSHGQSEVAFAFCHLLGFQLMPRLKGIHRQKLYRPEAGNPNAYPHLQLVLTRPINWELIRQQYDQMIKYATALRLGTAEPEAILRRFTRSNVKHPTYQALGELGKVLKTIFLCQYLHSEALRREINEGLNVVENWNSANSFIFYGKSGEIASNQRSEQEIAVLSLHLLQVSLVYINTLMLQEVLSEPAWSKKLNNNDQRALTPLIYGHVNPYGTFQLDLNKRLKIDRKLEVV